MNDFMSYGRHNVTVAEMQIKAHWYLVTDDVFGGVCISTDPRARSEHPDPRYVVASFLSPDVAACIVLLHNQTLDKK